MLCDDQSALWNLTPLHSVLDPPYARPFAASFLRPSRFSLSAPRTLTPFDPPVAPWGRKMPPRLAKKSVAKRSLPRVKNRASPAVEEDKAPASATIDESPTEEAPLVKEEPVECIIASPWVVEALPEEGKVPVVKTEEEEAVDEDPDEVEASVEDQVAAVQETAYAEKVEEAAVADKVDGEEQVDEEADEEVDEEEVEEEEEEDDDDDEKEDAARVGDGREIALEKDDHSVVLPSRNVEASRSVDDSIDVREADKADTEMDSDQGMELDGEGDEDGANGTEELNDGEENKSDDNADHEERDEDDASCIQAQMAERKKHKSFGIFIGGLDKSAVEEDIINVFGAYGDIQSVRIVKNPVTQKNKGYAFIHYANLDDAKKVLTELKDGTEVKGKRVGISASQDNDTLYLGNICKTWTKEQVIQTLKGYGINQHEDVIMHNDPQNEGKNKGFAFLEFNSHSDAMEAFHRLQKPDAVFGQDRSAKVAFAETSTNLCEEVLLQVKTVYVEGFPDSWDKNKINEVCQQYGEIENVQLFRKSAAKKKDFAFVEFVSRESALACVEGLSQFAEGENKVKANLARPSKGRVAKRTARGGFKIDKDADVTKQVSKSKKKKKSKSKGILAQGNVKGNTKKVESSNISQGKSIKPIKHNQPSKSDKGKKRAGRDRGVASYERASKRPRKDYLHGNSRGRPSGRDAYSRTPRDSYVARAATYIPRYVAPSTNSQGYTYSGASGSKPHHADLEPHAGYLPALQHRQYPHEYDSRYAAYDTQPTRGFELSRVLSSQTPFPVYSSRSRDQAGYAYPSSGAYPSRTNYPPHNYYYQ